MTEPHTQADEAESPLQFPCQFPIKVMGENSSAFVDAMHSIVLKHAPDYNTAATGKQTSRTEKYVSLTLEIDAQSKAQLDDIYRDITSHPLTKYTL